MTSPCGCLLLLLNMSGVFLVNKSLAGLLPAAGCAPLVPMLDAVNFTALLGLAAHPSGGRVIWKIHLNSLQNAELNITASCNLLLFQINSDHSYNYFLILFGLKDTHTQTAYQTLTLFQAWKRVRGEKGEKGAQGATWAPGAGGGWGGGGGVSDGQTLYRACGYNQYACQPVTDSNIYNKYMRHNVVRAPTWLNA